MQYCLLFSEDNQKLEREVNEYIRLGWRPQGGLAIGVINGHSFFGQAMVKG